ncbi:MAG: zf-TFIIB domain-containing protein [Fimbriimonadales bacterium]|nr:zf-TFIIB domain-containing protein [Fimbriimonadales bacterium]
MNCPDCRVELKRIEHAAAHLDACPICAGIWFEEDEILTVQSVQDGLRSLDQKVQPTGFGRGQGPFRLCPMCDSPLIRYRYLYTSNVELDGCDSCGGCWVENGELSAMQEFLFRERTEASSPAEMQKLLIGMLGAERAKNDAKAREFQQSIKSALRRRQYHWWIGYGQLKDD